MTYRKFGKSPLLSKMTLRAAFVAVILTVIAPFNIFSTTFALAEPDSIAASNPHSRKPVINHINAQPIGEQPDSTTLYSPELEPIDGDSTLTAINDSIIVIEDKVTINQGKLIGYDPDYIIREFNPDPTRAAWLSALFPGLGQLYNRRYWKLPIVVGGFMGLIYGYSWNNRMFEDYTQGYRDLMDSDPLTNSYLDFYPPGTDESSLNTSWLQSLFKSRKDYYRRNRDFCVIGMIGVYLVAIVDAYVDASLTHFDISPDLSIDMAPTFFPDGRARRPGFGFAWVLNF